MSMKLHTPILERYAETIDIEERVCEWPDCDTDGPHRAPKSHDRPNEFRWFCKDHARVYNKAWNFFEGMSDLEVEAVVRHDTVWNRPSWPIGSGPAIDAFMRGQFSDPFGTFGADSPRQASGAGAETPAPSDAEALRALTVLGLDIPFDMAAVKANYKALAKRYHPDAQSAGSSSGNADSDAKIKEINRAYQIVMAFLET